MGAANNKKKEPEPSTFVQPPKDPLVPLERIAETQYGCVAGRYVGVVSCCLVLLLSHRRIVLCFVLLSHVLDVSFCLVLSCTLACCFMLSSHVVLVSALYHLVIFSILRSVSTLELPLGAANDPVESVIASF